MPQPVDSASPRFDPARRRAVTLALVLVSALASFESTVVSTAMPTIIGDLGGLPLYAWVFSIYLLTSTVAMPVYGRLADIHGRRRMLLTGIAIFLTGAVACAFARSMPQLIAARALQGLGAAGLIPISMTVAADIYSIEERAKIQGVFSAVWGFSALVGPLLGAFLTVRFGWRSIFTINVPLGVVAFFIVATRLVESRGSSRDPMDLAGTAALATGVTLILFGVLHTPGAGGRGSLALRLALIVAGSCALAGFAALQTRRRHPLVPPQLFRHWDSASPYLSAILLGTTIFGVDTFVPLFVQGARGGTAAAAGAVVTPLVLFWALSAAAGGRIVVRFGFRPTARLGAASGARRNRRARRGGRRERERGVGLRGVRRDRRGARPVVDRPGARDPARGAGESAGDRDEPRPFLPDRRRLGRRWSSRRNVRRGACHAPGRPDGGGGPDPRRRARPVGSGRSRRPRPLPSSGWRSSARSCRCSRSCSGSPP